MKDKHKKTKTTTTTKNINKEGGSYSKRVRDK